jgi:hypothetical protein
MFISGFSKVQAQQLGDVRFEGDARYSLKRYGRFSPWQIRASVDKVVNYSFEGKYGYKVLLMISRDGYIPGDGVRGVIAARMNLGLLEPRTQYSGITLSARKRLPRGSFKVVLILANQDNTIAHAVNFPNRANLSR